MTQLSELVALAGPGLVFPQHDPAQQSLASLYDYFLRQGEHATYVGAAAAVALEASSPAFRKLQQDLQLRLLAVITTPTVEERSSENRQQRYHYIWKVIALGQQLRTSRSSVLLLPYLEEAYRMSEESELVEAAYLVATMLRRQYTNRRFDDDKYRYYRDRAAHYRPLCRAYQDAVSDLNEVYYQRNIGTDSESLEAYAQQAYLRHAHLVEAYDITMISYIVYLLELNPALLRNDYDGVIAVARRALTYLEGRQHVLPTMLQVLESNLTVAYTQRNDYDNGMRYARRLLGRTRREEFNYVKVYELMMVLSLRAAKFQEAYRLYREIDSEVTARSLNAYYQETFRIIEAYLYVLVSVGEVVPDADDETFDRFRVKRFLNSFEHVVAEKGSRHVHLLLIELIDQLIHRQHQRTSLSVEAVNKYVQRHLRGSGTERLRYFLKALTQLVEQQYHRTAVARHGARFIEKLRRYPLEESKLDYYMELIPYDKLWELLMGQLKNERVRGRRRR